MTFRPVFHIAPYCESYAEMITLETLALNFFDFERDSTFRLDGRQKQLVLRSCTVGHAKGE